jgi:DNA-binding SARP family transcriptional activator
MGGLRIQLFGNIRIIKDGEDSELRLIRTARLLFAYLLLERHRLHSRNSLQALFWADRTETRARSCLNTALWRLRRVLEPTGIRRGTYLVSRPTGEVGFNAESNHWLDVAAFDAAVRCAGSRAAHTLNDDDVERLEQALLLYKGDLLDGCYEEWALRERDRVSCLHLNVLECLMRYYGSRRDYDRALTCGGRILRQDVLREEIHREMMRLYTECGNKAMAVRQYRTCRDALREALSVDPAEETRALCHQILGTRDHSRSPSSTASVPISSLSQALQQLRLALSTFDEATGQLQRAIQAVEGASNGPERIDNGVLSRGDGRRTGSTRVPFIPHPARHTSTN